MSGYIGSKAVNLSTTGADINGNANVDGTLDVTGAFTSLGIDDNAAATAVTIDASGNVGIGTATPSTALEVSAAGTTNKLRVSNSSGSKYGEIYTDTNGVLIVDADADATGIAPNLRFRVSGTERMRIDSSGNVLVGTTGSVYSTPSKVEILYTGASQFGSNWKTTTSDGVPHNFVNSSGTRVGYIWCNATTTAYTTSSDYRLKENITPVQGASDIVKAMRPCTYTFKSDSTDWHDGFLAHELQELHPRAVTGEKDAVDEEGNPEYQGVDYSKLTPILTAALQEALNKIDALEARLTALEVTP